MHRIARLSLALPLALALASCINRSDLSPKTGSIAVTINGLPSGPAAVTVTGPNSYSQSVTATTTLSNLAPGSYTIGADTVVSGNGSYAPSGMTTVSVQASTTAVPVTISYALASGALALTVSGLPGGVNASVTVTGPGSFSQTATASQTWNNIKPGSYTITANTVTSGSSTYGGTPSTQTVNVPISLTAATATETYSLMTGSLAVTVSGTPAGLNPSVLVTGPFSYSHSITATGTASLTPLPLGAYTTAASIVSNATATYTPSPTSQVRTITAGALNQKDTVTYAISTGSLTVTISGLPGGVNAAVTVTGPGSFSQLLTATTTINKLAPGTYTVTAANVPSGGNTYVGTPTTQSPNVVASVTAATATVTYAISAGFDLTVDAVEIIQSTQSYTDTVPLVAGKNAYVRVFVLATQANSVTPKVRLRWYSSGTLVRTDTINAPGASVPTATSQATLASSWNLAIPGSLIASNLSVLADVDPGNLVAESNEGNNCWPLSCTAKVLDVRNVHLFRQMIVPVKTKKNGATGNVTAANQAGYLNFLMKIHPVASNAQLLHAIYTTTDSVDTLQSGDGNAMWETVLNEVTALRGAENTTPQLDSTYYYGVVHTGYGSGVAGLGWVGGLQTAIGWDGSISDQILAHETGHNWGLNHAPGCGAAGADPSYPNSSGHLDAFGVDPATTTLYDTLSNYDIMSYCRPSWISNYMYIHVLNFRASNKDVVGSTGASAEPVLLVWGRMVHGRLVLEPAFEVTAMAKLPQGGGSYTLQGLDAGGGTVFSYAFEPAMSMDTRAMGRGFVFAIPTGSFDLSRLASMRVVGAEGEARVNGGAAVMAKRAGAAPPTGISARTLAGGKAHVSWDARYPMAMIRDARTGQVLSFARGNSVDLAVPGTELTVTLSDGVRSVTETVIAQ